MKAIVHIGTEKTGTTSIQEYLYQNQNLLKDNGFYFIQSAGVRNNQALPSYCLNDDKIDDFFDSIGVTSLNDKKKFKRDFFKRFQNEIKSIPKNIHTVIISSEHFHSRTNTQEEVENVYKLLSTFFSEIKIVCYLREQVATCTSYYSTAIKTGRSPSLEKFLEGCNPGNIYYNYYEMLMNWERVFGLEALDVSIFDSNEFLNEDFLDDFTAKINPYLIGTLNKQISVENESLNFSGQVLGKAVNKAFTKHIEGKRLNSTRAKCEKIIYQECKGRGESPSIETQNIISSKFNASNESLRQKFFPGMKMVFKLRSDETLSNKAIDDGFVDILSSIFKVFIDEGNSMALPDKYADIFKEVALKLEKEDIELALELMNFAHRIRPSGPFIKQKVKEYQQILRSSHQWKN